MRRRIIKSIMVVMAGITCLAGLTKAQDVPEDSLLHRGRNLFYTAVESEVALDSAQAAFKQLLSEYSQEYGGRAQTYIGALTALRGKHALWPQKKYKYVMEGIDQMESGVAANPNDIESLFIYGSTCYHLPSFFGKSKEAQEAFRQIVALLPEHADQYDADMMENVIEFLRANANLDSSDMMTLSTIAKELGNG
ncbi:MAG: hypothetical protein K9N46_06310 [Candidatus Marinimicrobia bacterium]|nr:hypothetical protein [Candidatus Neomarinimicrobiota bacterium]MCF7828592.1 hypothetical protein [Candidatus Neomarinimicrobiota bacterium]MCF7880333.1 hypothetical protein [Candidatus Neomarinimicrobiota bacterium]